MTPFHGFIPVQARGVFTLPAELRRRRRLDQPGVQLEITEREDGVLEVRPVIAVDATQAWFWSGEWQEGERQASEEIARGEVTRVSQDELDQLIRSGKK